MAVPQTSINPTWRTIPRQDLYPGQTVRLSIRNYQARQDATVSILPTGAPSWVTIHEDGATKEIVIAVPSTETGGESYTIDLSASAFVTGQNRVVTNVTAFTINILAPVVPAVTIADQSLTAGVPFSLNLASGLTAGAPTPSYSFAPSFTPPSWLTLNGSTISGTPPIADYTAPTNLEAINLRATNVGGHTDFTVNLNIARAVAPGISSIANQYATQGVAFSLDLSSHLAGTPTPTLSATSLPTWLHVQGTSLVGTPSGFTANQTERVTVTATNVVSSVSTSFNLYIRVGSDTFTELTTGSPIDVPHNNLRALAATDNRLYYATSDSNGIVYAVNHAGVAQSSENITLSTTNSGNTTPIEGLAVYGGNLYVLGGSGTQYVYKYRLSDRSLIGIQNIGGPARAVSIPQIGEDHVMAVLRTSGNVQVWSILFPGVNAGPQPALGYALSENGVSANSWQALTFDSLDGKMYAGAPNTAGAFMFAFTTHGVRDVSEAIQLDSANNDPRGAAYIDDTMYVAQANSGASTGHVYIYNSIARVLPIPNQEGFDGEAWTLDLAPYLANSITVSFKSGTNPPHWLNLTNNVLSGTLPAVSRSRQDDTYNIQLTATHVDRAQDFSVNLTVKYIEAPTWGTIPAPTLDQNVTPNIPNVHPPLVLTAEVHLSDYITNYSRAGTITFGASDSEGSGTNPQLTTRVKDGVTINDVLTLTSPTTLPVENQDVASFGLRVEATNIIGHSFTSMPLDINHLQLPSINRLPAQSVNRNEIDSFDLSAFAMGRPAPTFALGTVTPHLDDNIVQITSNANGHWTIRPNQQLEILNTTYSVNVIALNRVGTANRNFQLTVHGVPHVDPDIAPQWQTTGLTFDVNTGAHIDIDLTTLISRSRPQPTFTIFNNQELRDLGISSSISGNTLTVTVPADLDTDIDRTVNITATNRAGSSEVPLTIRIHHVSAPVWRALPAQRVRPGDTLSLNLNTYVTGIPTPTIAFTTAPTGDAGNATLIDGHFNWVIPNTYTADTAVPFTFTATNNEGTSNAALSVNVITDAAPVWSDDAIVISVTEGDIDDEYDFAANLTAGSPIPTLSLDASAANIPATMSFQGTILKITPTSDFVKTMQFSFGVIATNSTGSANKAVTLNIVPVFTDGEDIVFSSCLLYTSPSPRD